MRLDEVAPTGLRRPDAAPPVVVVGRENLSCAREIRAFRAVSDLAPVRPRGRGRTASRLPVHPRNLVTPKMEPRIACPSCRLAESEILKDSRVDAAGSLHECESVPDYLRLFCSAVCPAMACSGTEDNMEASNPPTGAKVSFLLFFSAMGALATQGCGTTTDGSASPGDDVGNSAGGTEVGHPSTSTSGSAGGGASGDAAAGASSAGFSAIAAGDQDTYAIRDSAAYRLESYGPVPIEGLDSGVTAIAAATEQACAVVNGSAVCWGNFIGNWYNQDDHWAPAQVEGLTSDVTAISTNVAYYGLDNACAVVSGGVMCWGWSYGAGIDSDDWPVVQVEGITAGATAIATAGHHSCAVVNGGVECWGENSAGELGNGTMTDSSVPVQVQGLTSGVTAVGVGDWNSCAIVDAGVWCWGAGANVLDDGTATNSSVPVQVPGLTSGVTALAVGFSHSCAVVNGGAECWGANYAGQLGDGTTTGSWVPVQVQGLTSGVTAIATGYLHSCAIANGGVWCWGDYDPTPARVVGT